LVIQVSGLSKSYGSVVALSDLSFQVEKGEVFGFLGPNGAGKTTTIRLIMQLLNADSGEIYLFDNKIYRRKFKHRNLIGYLPGDFQPPLEMKASYYLDYIANFRSRPPVLRNDLIQQLHLQKDDLGKKIKYLSHGNRQKVGLISAMEHEPDLVILDEPTLGLDPLIQEAFFQIIHEFKEKNKTVFLSSHILTEVEKVCHRVAIIREGKLVTVEPLEELKHKQLRRLLIEFDAGIEPFPPEIPGMKLLSCENRRCVFMVEGKAKQIIEELSKLPVLDFIFPEAELEDIFMAYYQGNKDV